MKKCKLMVHLSDGKTVERGVYESSEDAQAEIDNMKIEGLRLQGKGTETIYPPHSIQKYVISES